MTSRKYLPEPERGFTRWTETRVASVKDFGEDMRGDPFPKEMLKSTLHPDVIGRGEPVVQALLAEALVKALYFTFSIECEIVWPAALAVLKTGYGFDLRRSDYKATRHVLFEEASHVLQAGRLADLSGGPMIEHRGLMAPGITRSNRRNRRNLAQNIRRFATLFAAIVTEVGIPGGLIAVARDPAVAPAVAEVFMQHGIEEARHALAFGGLLERIWPQLSGEMQEAAAPVLGDLLLAFSRPDLDWETGLLRRAGFSRDQAIGIIADAYPETALRDASRAGAASFVRHMQRAGALDRPAVVDALSTRGLIA